MLNDPNDKWNALLSEWERQNREYAEFEATLNDCAIPTLQVPNDILDAFTETCTSSRAFSPSSVPLTGLRA